MKEANPVPALPFDYRRDDRTTPVDKSDRAKIFMRAMDLAADKAEREDGVDPLFDDYE